MYVNWTMPQYLGFNNAVCSKFWKGIEWRERNRRIIVDGDEVIYILYRTPVAVWNRDEGTLYINHGGYKTVTTISTINHILDAIGGCVQTARISGSDKELVVSYMGDMVRFDDGGVKIDLRNGRLIGPRDFIYKLGNYIHPIKSLIRGNIKFEFGDNKTIVESGIDYLDKIVLIVNGKTVDVYRISAYSLSSFAKYLYDPTKLFTSITVSRTEPLGGLDRIRVSRILGDADEYEVGPPKIAYIGRRTNKYNRLKRVGKYMRVDTTEIYFFMDGPGYIVKVMDGIVTSVRRLGIIARVFGEKFPIESPYGGDCAEKFLRHVKMGIYKLPEELVGPLGEMVMIRG